jgi:dephospho-CoA kinase
MLVIGLTGGIGSGKSEVARLLEAFGANLISADQVGHEAYTWKSEAWISVVEAFGEGVLQPNGDIDRQKLGTIVFSDPVEMDRLNNIMHPRMANIVEKKIDSFRENGSKVVIVEAAVLFEAGWESLVDEVWTVSAPIEMIVDRLKSRNGLSSDEARQRIASQMSTEERLNRSHAEVDNSGDVSALSNVVKILWENRVKAKVEKV